MKFAHALIVLHGTIFLSLAPLYANAPTPALIVLATDNQQANEHIQLGWRDYLMGWDEMAAVHFRQAVAADDNSLLAWCGLSLTEGISDEAFSALSIILDAELPMTPQESALASILLQLCSGDRSGAGEELAARAEQFRHDRFAACLAIVLLHDGYDSVSGKPLPNQQRALELAGALYERYPNDALVAYLRGWIESAAPEPAEVALAAAKNAAETLPEHPAPQLLYGHLLYRKGQLKEAIPYIHQASQLAEKARQNVPCGTIEQVEKGAYPLECAVLEIRAKLYESTLLWLDGQGRASLLLQSELLRNAQGIKTEYKRMPGAVLLRWEAQTLPLRLLMLSPKLPNDAQVSAAAKAALPHTPDKEEPLLDVRDCLRFCIVARQRAAAGRLWHAKRCIESAEDCLARLDAARGVCEGLGPATLSAWTRAREACQQALLAAKAATYPESSELWLNSLEQAQRPSTLLMPLVLPTYPR